MPSSGDWRRRTGHLDGYPATPWVEWRSDRRGTGWVYESNVQFRVTAVPPARVGKGGGGSPARSLGRSLDRTRPATFLSVLPAHSAITMAVPRAASVLGVARDEPDDGRSIADGADGRGSPSCRRAFDNCRLRRDESRGGHPRALDRARWPRSRPAGARRRILPESRSSAW